jgi:hypothetical protein
MKTQGDPSAIRLYMPVLAMDATVLGHVFAVGRRFLALERGTFRPREWRASLEEVARVDEQGVWLKHGLGALEPVFGFFSGPIARYRPAADASPIHEWTGFDPPAVDEIGEGSEEPEDPGETVH